MNLVKILPLLIMIFFVGCSDNNDNDEKTTQVTPEAAEDSDFIVFSSGDTNNGGVFAYGLSGEFIRPIVDLRQYDPLTSAQGIAAYDLNSILLSVNGADSVLDIRSSGESKDENYNLFYGSSLLNGNLYDIEFNPILNYFYVVESNNIEVFDLNGFRITSALIPQTLGACVLSSPKNISITDDGTLYVASANSRILKYDVSNATPTCLDSYTVVSAPYAVIKHTNGLLYYTATSLDALYSYDENTGVELEVFRPGTAVLNDPKALVEMSNGDMLVSASTNDSIERVTEDGTRVGAVPFILDTNSLNVTDIEILRVESPGILK